MFLSAHPVEFSVPLTPLLISVVREVRRLEEVEDREAIKLIIECIQPLLKERRTCEESL